MNSYTFGVPINPGELHYGYMEYSCFTVREVFIDERSNGEYHVSPDSLNLKEVINIFKDAFNGFDIGVVDPSGDLNLAYSIYIIAKTEMQKLTVVSIFEKINEILEEKLNLKRGSHE